MEREEFAAKNLLNVEMEKNTKKYDRDACRKHKVGKHMNIIWTGCE